MAISRSVLCVLVLPATLFVLCSCGHNQCAEVEMLPGGPASLSEKPPRYLAIGDSLMAENGDSCQGIPGFLSQELGAYVETHAAIGWPISNGGEDDIIGQYKSGNWDWVVMTGGANDLLQECWCNGWWETRAACQDVLDTLVMPDKRRGDIYEIVDRVQADGAKLIIMGYYGVGEDAVMNFDGCMPYGEELNRRYKQLAEKEEGVEYLSTQELMTRKETPEWYKDDEVHPSPEGSQGLARSLAAFIAGHE